MAAALIYLGAAPAGSGGEGQEPCAARDKGEDRRIGARRGESAREVCPPPAVSDRRLNIDEPSCERRAKSERRRDSNAALAHP